MDKNNFIKIKFGIVTAKNQRDTHKGMTRSPERDIDIEFERIRSEVSNPVISTHFDVEIGKKRTRISESDLKSKKSLLAVGNKIAGKKKLDVCCNSFTSKILGCASKKDAKFHVVCGALFILGKRLLIVLGFQPIRVTVIFEGAQKRFLLCRTENR